MELKGNIITGTFDTTANEFVLQRVKHLSTETVLTENQLQSLYEYLNEHKHNEEGQVITLYDQIPILLNKREIQQMLEDLQEISSIYT